MASKLQQTKTSNVCTNRGQLMFLLDTSNSKTLFLYKYTLSGEFPTNFGCVCREQCVIPSF